MRRLSPIAPLLGPALAAFLSSGPGAAQEIANPDLFGKSLLAAHQVLEHFGEVDDPDQLRRVADIGYRLAAQSDFRDMPFSFYLIDMPAPNAFALPGGHIFVTRGMLALDLDDDMLANLMGHEIAHVIHRHGIRMQRRATLLNALSQALLLGVLIGVDDDSADRRNDPYGTGRAQSRKGSMIEGSIATGVVVSELLLRNFSRSFEDEADIEGQRLAAAAGFDPAGAAALWRRMNERIPSSRQYGYWRTHPFSEQRERAGDARAAELKVQSPAPDAAYRQATQAVLLEHTARKNVRKPKATAPDEEPPDLERFLRLSALVAWPRGASAEEIRLGELHRRRDAELERSELQRDYGALVRAYDRAIEEVRALTPETDFLATLAGERDALAEASAALYPRALEVWEEGIYQTAFLETFLSNYPDAEIESAVALALGDAYARVSRQGEAVEQYLHAADGAGQPAVRALQGLRNLAPYLDDLAALETLAADVGDAELAELARARRDDLARSYGEVEVGAAYLHRYPEGAVAAEVARRLETLATNLYGEVLLYQAVGDHVKALERIQKILVHAPESAAADSLRQRAEVRS